MGLGERLARLARDANTPNPKEVPMTRKQIETAGATTQKLLALTLPNDPSGLEPTSTPISTELVWPDAIAVTLHAVQSDGNDVEIRATIFAAGGHVLIQRRDYDENDGWGAWDAFTLD
jgi:hypothetical protein